MSKPATRAQKIALGCMGSVLGLLVLLIVAIENATDGQPATPKNPLILGGTLATLAEDMRDDTTRAAVAVQSVARACPALEKDPALITALNVRPSPLSGFYEDSLGWNAHTAVELEATLASTGEKCFFNAGGGYRPGVRVGKTRCLATCGLPKPADGREAMVDDAALASLGAFAPKVNPRAREEFNTLQASALRGNYQSQRNLAWALSRPGQHLDHPQNPTLGCAWRIVILLSGHQQANETDDSNRRLYCGRLTPAEQDEAGDEANRLLDQIRHPSR